MNKEIKEMCHKCKRYPAEYNQTYCEFCLGISDKDDYITNLQEENERIKKMNMHEHKYGSDMEGKYLIEKAKNDKAIEYVEECYTQPPNIENFMHEGEMNYLLNILRGDKDE